MFSYFIRPLRRIANALVSGDTPRQLAAGATLGMVLGLVPKGNLIAVVLVMLLLSLRINKILGLAAAVLFSWIGLALDPFAHKIGLALLHVESMQGFYAWLFDRQLGPWIGFNNTVVLGSLLIGLYCFYPVYWFGCLFFEWFQPKAAAWVQKYRITRLLFGLDWGARWGTSL